MVGDSIFVADMHFMPRSYPDQVQRQHDFIRFLESVVNRPQIRNLYIIGDMFDFWYEYRYYIPKDYFEILHSLKSLVQAGKTIHYFAGNHDFKLGSFFEDQIGMILYRDELVTHLDQKTVFIHHGDGFARNDWRYRCLKKALRNPFNQKLFSLLHPDLGMRLGLMTSKGSRRLNPGIKQQLKDDYREWAVQLFKQMHYDVIIIGHTHLAWMELMGKSLFINLGSWLDDYYYLAYSGNKFTMMQYSINEG